MHWRKMKVAYDGSVFLWPLYLFNSWLRLLSFKISSFRITWGASTDLFDYNKTCASIKYMVFHSKCCEAGIASALYTSLRWLFSLNWNLIQPYLHTVCDTSYILKDRRQNSFCSWLGGKFWICVCFVPVNDTVTILQIYKVYISHQWVVSDFVFGESNHWFNWKSFLQSLIDL